MLTSTDRELLWDCRRTGKAGWLTPEQYTPEWDRVKDNPCVEGFEEAGNYGARTNIYMDGQVRHSSRLFPLTNYLLTLLDFEILWFAFRRMHPMIPPSAVKFTAILVVGTSEER